MEYIYSAMLLHKAGKTIDEGAIDAVLKAAGVTPDPARIKATVAALKEVDVDKVISEASIAAPAATAAPAAGGEAPAEAPKEEKKEEDKGATEEEAAAGLGALFG